MEEGEPDQRGPCSRGSKDKPHTALSSEGAGAEGILCHRRHLQGSEDVRGPGVGPGWVTTPCKHQAGSPQSRTVRAS